MRGVRTQRWLAAHGAQRLLAGRRRAKVNRGGDAKAELDVPLNDVRINRGQHGPR